MVTQELLSVLWCPTCRDGALRLRDGTVSALPLEQGELECITCGSVYPVEGGVPALLPHSAISTEAWELWRKHLDKFQARREDRIANPTRAVTLSMKTSRPQEPFARFIAIERGAVLDVGCGPGKFRHNFDERRVRYFGVDPIALPELEDFPFARGLAEYLPFRDASFTDVVVLAAIDHFRDIALFFREAARVLSAEGRLHILQSVHELRGPLSAVKVLGHKVKDALEDWETRDHGTDVPKHLNEFTTRSLVEVSAPYFEVAALQEYDSSWYTPTKLFLSLKPNGAAARPSESAARNEATGSLAR